jgi:hypothetical protein
VFFICLVRHDGYNYFVSFFSAVSDFSLLEMTEQCGHTPWQGGHCLSFQPKIEEGLI